MKPTTFNYSDYAQLLTKTERNNTYTNALIAENKQLREDVVALRAERDALAKSIRIVSQPIETIQPRGITE